MIMLGKIDQQDGIVDDDTGQRDEAQHAWHGEVEAEQDMPRNGTNQCKRDDDHHDKWLKIATSR